MKLIVLDLEMAQPSKQIIQIGAIVGDLKTGKIVDSFSKIINPHEVLSPFIIELTGITQEDVDNGCTLIEAYDGLIQMHKRHKCHKSAVVWGSGDCRVLKEQVKQRQSLLEKEWWKLGYREIDTKTIYQVYSMANGQTMKAGLQTACEKMGIEFKGRAHDALVDAQNTWAIFYKLQKLLSV